MRRLRSRRSPCASLCDALAVLIWLGLIVRVLAFAFGVLLGLAEGLSG